MIRLPPEPEWKSLAPDEQFGLTLLIDCSRLLPVDDPSADVVRLRVVEGRPDSAALIGGRWGLEPGDGELRVPRTLLRQVTALAGAGEEQKARGRDRHGRVPAYQNPLVAAGGERFRDPVVSRLAVALREQTLAAAGRRPVRLLVPWPGGRRWAAAFTHDLDVVAGWPLFTLLRLAELARAGDWRRAARVLGAAARAVGARPVWRGVFDLLLLEASSGVRSTWFLLCGTPSPWSWGRGDVTYRVESRAAHRILTAALRQGHEVGLHGSFATATDPDRFAAERRRLEAAAGRSPTGVRQHFLRLRPGLTPRAQRAAGFTYDASMGFSDRNGFRLGLADITSAWDAERQAPLDLALVPLVWMDRALSKYEGVQDPGRWVDDALALAGACRAVEGLWVGLWHPNVTDTLGFPGAGAALARLVAALLGDRPHVDRLDALVAWRTARRTVRARRVGADGAIELTGTGAIPVELEPARR